MVETNGPLMPIPPEIQQAWAKWVANAPTPQWILDLRAHYRRTGTYREEDLARLSGDPCRGASLFGTDAELRAWFFKRVREIEAEADSSPGAA
jgi:hypothetical protein